MLRASVKDDIPTVCPGCGYPARDQNDMIAHWFRSRAYDERGTRLRFMPAKPHSDPNSPPAPAPAPRRRRLFHAAPTLVSAPRAPAALPRKEGDQRPTTTPTLTPTPSPLAERDDNDTYEVSWLKPPSIWRRYIFNWRYAWLMFNLGVVSFIGTMVVLYCTPRIYTWYGPWPLTIIIPWANLGAWILGHWEISVGLSAITVVSLRIGVLRQIVKRALRLILLAFWCFVGAAFIVLCWVTLMMVLVWLLPKY